MKIIKTLTICLFIYITISCAKQTDVITVGDTTLDTSSSYFKENFPSDPSKLFILLDYTFINNNIEISTVRSSRESSLITH